MRVRAHTLIPKIKNIERRRASVGDLVCGPHAGALWCGRQKDPARTQEPGSDFVRLFFFDSFFFHFFFIVPHAEDARSARALPLFCFLVLLFFISSRGRPPPPDEKPKNPFCQRTKKSNLPVRMTLFFLVWFVSCRPAKRNNDRPDGMHGFRCRRLTARALHKSVLSTHSYNRMHHYWFPGCWPTQTAKGSATRALRRPAPRHNIPTLVKKSPQPILARPIVDKKQTKGPPPFSCASCLSPRI